MLMVFRGNLIVWVLLVRGWKWRGPRLQWVPGDCDVL